MIYLTSQVVRRGGPRTWSGVWNLKFTPSLGGSTYTLPSKCLNPHPPPKFQSNSTVENQTVRWKCRINKLKKHRWFHQKKNRLRRNYSDVACTGQVALTNSLYQLNTDINSIEYYCHLYKEVQIVPTTMIGWYENVN